MVRGMDAAIAGLHAEDSQERIAAVKKLQVLLEQNQKGLSASEVGTLLNATVDLLKDNDHEVCQGALHVLASAASLAGERLQLDFVALLPVILDRLGDEKQSVRDAGRGLLLALMQIFTPTVVLQRVIGHVSQHKNWKVREEFVRILTSAVRLFPEKDLPSLPVILPLILNLMEDGHPHVREATLAFVEKMYQLRGTPFKEELQRLSMLPSKLKDMNNRLDKVEAKCTCKPATPGNAHVDSPTARDPPVPASPSVQIDVQLDGASEGISMTIEEKEPRIQKCCDNTLEGLRNVPGLITLDETLTGGLGKCVDWSIRVAAFNFTKKLIAQGHKGLQEVLHCFDNVIKMLQEHLTHAHYKVSQAALSTLVEVVKHCKKAFTEYLEQILPLLFTPLVDPREETSELAAEALQTIGNSYDIKLLFPALLRCLDEQRTPKGQIAAIEYAIGAVVKLEFHYETISPLLKPWLAKLAVLIKLRNTSGNARLRETAAMGIIAVYSHLDTILVLEFLLSLSTEDQTRVRRALKQYVPQIEVDLIYHIRNRKHRVPCISLEDPGEVRKPYWNVFPDLKSCERRVLNPHELDRSGVHEGMVKNINYNCRTTQHWGDPFLASLKLRDYNTGWDINVEKTRRWLDLYNVDPTGKLDEPQDPEALLIQRMLNWSPTKTSAEKHDSLQAAAQLFQSTDQKSWPEYFDKLFSIELEAIKDPEQIIRDAALVVIPDLLRQLVARIHDHSLLNEKLPVLLPALLEAFGHHNEIVRKAVLHCFVELYHALGTHVFLPHLSTLNPVQLSLITTYASRITHGGASMD